MICLRIGSRGCYDWWMIFPSCIPLFLVTVTTIIECYYSVMLVVGISHVGMGVLR